ncbi:pimeloyl-ACP methyl ester carboxylesterase [Thermocatellispora tengchongensis]|uniref:Pimeloyl-ACP methyl ester carboxylesterase n=1 Tax=Thermocatellispora tengchongensis TaxID=1073253 RepID=A0A840PFK2_9ACTN|nr:alpha/beta hydrolase [Thermocatellispora tengchongensis]MBB5137769.1 pimeloyl-ACP methyl ester carboxylesterase [Thermocatellispora tengchongensis]
MEQRRPLLTEQAMTGSAGHITSSWRYERLEGAGHWMQLDHPEKVSELLLDFFSTVWEAPLVSR